MQLGRSSTARAQGAGPDGGTARGRWNSGRADERLSEEKRMRSRAGARNGMRSSFPEHAPDERKARREREPPPARCGVAADPDAPRRSRSGPIRFRAISVRLSASPIKRPAPGSGSETPRPDRLRPRCGPRARCAAMIGGRAPPRAPPPARAGRHRHPSHRGASHDLNINSDDSDGMGHSGRPQRTSGSD